MKVLPFRTHFAASLAMACFMAGCATTPYTPPSVSLTPPPADKAKVYFIMWTAPDTSWMGDSSFALQVNGKRLADLTFQTYVQHTCDPGEVKMALGRGFALSQYVIFGIAGGPIGLGLAGVMDGTERVAKSGKDNLATLTAEAGKSYFIEIEPPPKGTKALFKLRTLDPYFAEHRIAACREVKPSSSGAAKPASPSGK